MVTAEFLEHQRGIGNDLSTPMPAYRFPGLVPGDLEKPDLGQLGAFVQSLTTAGAQMFPDRELENHLREAAGLPLAPEEAEMDMEDGEEINPLLNPEEPEAPAKDDAAATDDGEED